MLPLLLALACSGAHKPAAIPTTDAPAPVALHGDAFELALPDFQGVVASDGSPRHRDALLGQPTAMWFYPAAGTYG